MCCFSSFCFKQILFLTASRNKIDWTFKSQYVIQIVRYTFKILLVLGTTQMLLYVLETENPWPFFPAFKLHQMNVTVIKIIYVFYIYFIASTEKKKSKEPCSPELRCWKNWSAFILLIFCGWSWLILVVINHMKGNGCPGTRLMLRHFPPNWIHLELVLAFCLPPYYCSEYGVQLESM